MSPGEIRAAPLARPECTRWFVLYFDFVLVVLLFLGVVRLAGFESSSRTVMDNFSVSILYRAAVRAMFESFARVCRGLYPGQ